MATFGELLATSLDRVKGVAKDNIVQASHIGRTDRERLLKNGWLTPIIRGWYILGHPEGQGETTQWYATYWHFVRDYLAERYGEEYCLSPESSLDFWLDQNNVPQQLMVVGASGGNTRVALPHETSLLVWKGEVAQEREVIEGIQTLPLAAALCRASPSFFSHNPTSAEIALRMVEPAAIARYVLDGGRSVIAGRMVAAYRFLGDEAAAETIMAGYNMAGERIRETNPFTIEQPLLGQRSHQTRSPYAARIEALWQQMREGVIAAFPKAPGLPDDASSYLAQVEERYRFDAYHSLSIEGYQVNYDLIERIRQGAWNPDDSANDRDQHNAMAAKGYHLAFNKVCESLSAIFENATPGEVIERDLHKWYQLLFEPSVQTALVRASDLAGYRNDQVFIRGAAHVPPPKSALMDAMEAFFYCLKNEPEASVRAVLGHFMFVFIHPYMDGNGRIGRFIMNAMLASGGYRWTVIRSDKSRRDKYMDALDLASSKHDITAFAEFVAEEMAVEWGSESVGGE